MAEDKRIADLAEQAMHASENALEAFYASLDAEDTFAVQGYLAGIAQRAVFAESYIAWRVYGQDQEYSLQRARTALRGVRRAMGYVNP